METINDRLHVSLPCQDTDQTGQQPTLIKTPRVGEQQHAFKLPQVT